MNAENNTENRSLVSQSPSLPVYEILITGSTGFLGREITRVLAANGIKNAGLARSGAEIECDLSREVPQFDEVYDTIIHAAGLAHVVSEEGAFYEVNFRGTDRLLSALDKNPPRRFVLISTVAVYGLETGEMIDENTPCHPTTAYGKSKLLAEQAVRNWSVAKGIKALILRLPLVNGKKPPGNLGAMREAMKKGRYFRIGKGNVRKSWVQATEVVEFILNNPDLEGTYNLTSAHHPTLAEIENQIAREFNLPEPKNIPYGIAWLLANTFGRIPDFPLSLNRFRKLTTDLTFTSKHLKEGNGLRLCSS